MMNGYDESSTMLSLAKQLLMDCERGREITLPSATLKLVLDAYIQQWASDQDRKRNDYKKAATGG